MKEVPCDSRIRPSWHPPPQPLHNEPSHEQMAIEERQTKYGRDLQLQLSQMTGIAPETKRPIGDHMKEIEDRQKRLNVEPWSTPQIRPAITAKRRLSTSARKLSPTQRTIDQCMGTHVSFPSSACLAANRNVASGHLVYKVNRSEYTINLNLYFQKKMEVDIREPEDSDDSVSISF